MSSKEKVEAYILQMDVPYEEVDDSMWIIYENELNSSQKIVVSFIDSIVHFRMKVMDLPKDTSKHLDLFRKLLEINATGLSHGAFALEEDVIVILDSLQSENLDFNEFQASVEALFFGIMDTYEVLSKFRDKEPVS